MLRTTLLPTALLFMLAGCPIWSGEGGDGDGDFCESDAQCSAGQVCGSDNECHEGTCETWGCPEGEVCLTDVDGLSACFDTSSGAGGSGGDGGSGGSGGAGGSGAGGSGGAGGASPIYCGNPDDCGAGETCAPDGTCQAGACDAVGCIFGFFCDGLDGVCLHINPLGCAADADCTNIGDRCVSGECTAPEDVCFDQTQCAGGSVCANGKCTPSCATGSCDEHHSCTAGVELCTTPVLGCSITNDCGGPDLVCVDGTCVERSDGATCDAGYVWVENGCIPDQSAIFVCGDDGVQDTCASGSICVHHSCYISCAAPADAACDGLPDFDVCKPVTTTTGTFPVCGSEDNLGGECDPTSTDGSCAAGLVCIDGFCK